MNVLMLTTIFHFHFVLVQPSMQLAALSQLRTEGPNAMRKSCQVCANLTDERKLKPFLEIKRMQRNKVLVIKTNVWLAKDIEYSMVFIVLCRLPF